MSVDVDIVKLNAYIVVHDKIDQYLNPLAMKRPTSRHAKEFREWNKKKKHIRKYINEVLDLDNYGHPGAMKKFHEWNKGEQQQNLWFYADIILANALMDALPKKMDPIIFCEAVFGKPAPADLIPEPKPKPKPKSKVGGGKKKEVSPKERIRRLMKGMSKEEREQLKRSLQ